MSIHVESVSKLVDDVFHLDDIELELEPGQLYVLLGPTTAGKTTLMRVLAGLEHPTDGKLLVDGKDLTETHVRKRDVAMVYQQFVNYPAFTVYQNIAAPLHIRGLPASDIDFEVNKIAKLLHINKLLDRRPAELSGGQQQRCAIARALIKNSSLVLLDEPLVNLDYKLREELREELRELFGAGEAIVVYSTTEPLEALTMGGKVIVMDKGRVLQMGPSSSVYHRPGSINVAKVFSDPPMNMIEVEIQDGVASAEGEFELPVTGPLLSIGDGRVTLGIRANHLQLKPNSGEELAIEGRVELSEISGSETFVHIAHNRTSWVVQEPGVQEYEIGSKITIYLDSEKLYAFGETGALEVAPVLSES